MITYSINELISSLELGEKEAKKIMQSIDSGLKDVKEGKTYSIDKLWDRLF